MKSYGKEIFDKIVDKEVAARFKGENVIAKTEEVNYIDVSAQQIISVTASCIPFLDHDDAHRSFLSGRRLPCRRYPAESRQRRGHQGCECAHRF